MTRGLYRPLTATRGFDARRSGRRRGVTDRRRGTASPAPGGAVRAALIAAASVLALAGCATSAVTLTTTAPAEADKHGSPIDAQTPADTHESADATDSADTRASVGAPAPPEVRSRANELPVTVEIIPSSEDPAAAVSGEARITSPLMPALTLVGDVVPTDGAADIYLTELRIFTNWANGWTEGRYEASGRIRLEPRDAEAPDARAASRAAPAVAAVGLSKTAYTIAVADPLQMWSIVEGEIRYYDTYHRHDDGVAKVRARVDRVRELADWLREEQGFRPVYRVDRPRLLERIGSPSRGGRGSRGQVQSDAPAGSAGSDEDATAAASFHEAVLPVLFPEVAGDPIPGGATEVGSDILWSIGYTETHFPERFRRLRNSGTLYRDYEEAFGLFYSFYNLPYLMTALDGAVLHLE